MSNNDLKINPKSIPGRVLADRKKNPGPLGSRSNPWPKGTAPHVMAGMSKKDFNKLSPELKAHFTD